MSRRPSLPVLLRAIVWITLCGAYLVIGGRKVVRALTAGPIAAVAPFHSTDLYLEELTGMRRASQRLIDMFAMMPPGKSVSIILREGRDYDSFVAFTITYLAWPKEVQTIPVRKENAENELRSIDPQTCAAIVFCGLKPPPWIRSGIPLGFNLIIVPLSDTEDKGEP
jgi:hypothetical protein